MMTPESILKKWEEMLWNGYMRHQKNMPEGVSGESIEASFRVQGGASKTELVFRMPISLKPYLANETASKSEEGDTFIFANPSESFLRILISNELRAYIFKQHKMLGTNSPFNQMVLHYANSDSFPLEGVAQHLILVYFMVNTESVFYGSKSDERNEFLDAAIAKVNSLKAMYPGQPECDIKRYARAIDAWSKRGAPNSVYLNNQGELKAQGYENVDKIRLLHLMHSFLKKINDEIHASQWMVGKLGGLSINDTKYPAHISQIRTHVLITNRQDIGVEDINRAFVNVVALLEQTQKHSKRSKAAEKIDFLGLYKRNADVQAFYDEMFSQACTIMPLVTVQKEMSSLC